MILAACTPAPAPPAQPTSVQSMDDVPVVVLDLREELGSVTASPRVASGTYELSLNYTWRGYISMERVILRSTRGELRVTLTDDGVLDGELHTESKRSSSVSRHASHDGKHHTNTLPPRKKDVKPISGVWEQQAEYATLTIQTYTYTANPQSPVTPEPPLTLSCWTLNGPKFPTPTLACRPSMSDDAFGLLREMSVAATRTTPLPSAMVNEARMAETPWLLLGAAPGLRLNWGEVDQRSVHVHLSARAP